MPQQRNIQSSTDITYECGKCDGLHCLFAQIVLPTRLFSVRNVRGARSSIPTHSITAFAETYGNTQRNCDGRANGVPRVHQPASRGRIFNYCHPGCGGAGSARGAESVRRVVRGFRDAHAGGATACDLATGTERSTQVPARRRRRGSGLPPGILPCIEQWHTPESPRHAILTHLCAAHGPIGRVPFAPVGEKRSCRRNDEARLRQSSCRHIPKRRAEAGEEPSPRRVQREKHLLRCLPGALPTVMGNCHCREDARLPPCRRDASAEVRVPPCTSRTPHRAAQPRPAPRGARQGPRRAGSPRRTARRPARSCTARCGARRRSGAATARGRTTAERARAARTRRIAATHPG